MSGEFATLDAALVAIAKTITGLDQVVWENQKRPFVSPSTRAIALLSFGETLGIGRDEVIQAFDPTELSEEDILDGEGEFTFTVAGVRRLPWRIKVESYEQGTIKTAWKYLEDARTALSWPSVLDALDAANVATVEVLGVLDLQVPKDERMVSMASLDIILAGRFSSVDPRKATYINSFSGTGELKPRAPVEYEAP